MGDQAGIYIIRNQVSGKAYVGQSIELNQRVRDHLRELRKGTHFNKHLQSAWNQDGEDAFKFEILEFCDQEQLDDREIKHIAQIEPTKRYNKTSGGQENFSHTEEVKRRIGEAASQRYDLSRERLREANILAWKDADSAAVRKKKISNTVRKLWDDPGYRANATRNRKNRYWVTNGSENQTLPADASIPDGWYRGMTKKA
jgi:group I intron endonuclease